MREERKMTGMKWGAAAMALGVMLAQPVEGQQEAVAITVRGGGFNALTSLNEPGTADFKQVGYNVGGGVGVDLSRYLGLRGDFAFARNELELNEASTGANLSRYFYDAALQVRYPAASGWTPYAFVGGGAVTLDPEGSDNATTKPAGTVGLGLGYAIPGTNLGIGIEGKGWLYEFSELNGGLSAFDKTQFEITWSAGLSYRFLIAVASPM
jgi:opacity protein-like surface antigen